MNERERLGWLVRKTWVECVRELMPDPKESWVAPWEELDEFQREADMRIGEAVAGDREAEIRRQLAHIQMLGREHNRHALAVSAHKARADQLESRAIKAEKQLARFADIAERYDALAQQAADGERAADLVKELGRRIRSLERQLERARAAGRADADA
jgi:hypothetical protein